MDPSSSSVKKRKQPDSAFDEDPSSGDWRKGVPQDLRLQSWNAIEHGIQELHKMETPMFYKETSETVEGMIYKEATSQDDYKARIVDYMQKIPHTSGILQDEQADLNSQMGNLDNSQEQPLAGLPSEGNTILPPDQQQPQQPQQQQSDPDDELYKDLVDKDGNLFWNIF